MIIFINLKLYSVSVSISVVPLRLSKVRNDIISFETINTNRYCLLIILFPKGFIMKFRKANNANALKMFAKEVAKKA